MSSPLALSAQVLHSLTPIDHHEQLLAAVVGVLCRLRCRWWCRPSHYRHRRPRRAVLVLLLGLAIALLARRCPALASLAQDAVSTRNPPRGAASFLSFPVSPWFPISIPIVPHFAP